MNKLEEVSKKLMFKIDNSVKSELEKEWKLIEGKLKKLKGFKTDGVEPMIFIDETPKSFLRSDETIENSDKKTIIANAPKVKGDYILIPKVVKND